MYKTVPNNLIVAKEVLFLPKCLSTNNFLQDLNKQKELKEGLVVITNEQLAGKGQMGARWEAAPNKNLTFSILFKPNFLELSQQFYFSMAIALAIKDALMVFIQEKVSIKWPNDIYVNDLKIAGILVQNKISGRHISESIVGIGLNVNQTFFEHKFAISLGLITGKDIKLQTVFEVLMMKIDQRYALLKSHPFEEIKKEYEKQMYLKDEQANFEVEGESIKAIIRGVGDMGKLLIEMNGVLKSYNLKEIKYLRMDEI